ncbi:DUF2834 domain-containing protein [Dactylosporangium sp. NPDC050688]|uniref:DUF2834 domain-containing protein n=1 Tax=Dactylosporangium sp. NPDC050688 TaxID=3157217 RepID=UPI0033E3B28F
MDRVRRLEALWLMLLLAGLVVPYTSALPWLFEYGLDVVRFRDDLFANRISTFFGWDVIIAVAVITAMALTEPTLCRSDRIAVITGSLLGASVGLPLYLWLRARRQRLTAEP